MKITLYTPDGTAETFTDCTTFATGNKELGFNGTDWRKKRLKILTTLPYRIVEDATPAVAPVGKLGPITPVDLKQSSEDFYRTVGVLVRKAIEGIE